MPSYNNFAVPAFGTQLPRAPQVPQGSSASRQPTSFPIPVQSRKRTLAEIEAQDDELELEEERLSRALERVKADRKQLKEERKRAYQG